MLRVKGSSKGIPSVRSSQWRPGARLCPSRLYAITVLFPTTNLSFQLFEQRFLVFQFIDELNLLYVVRVNHFDETLEERS